MNLTQLFQTRWLVRAHFSLSQVAEPLLRGLASLLRTALCAWLAIALSSSVFAQSVTGSITAGGSPSAIAVNPVTSNIYVANSASDTVSVIDGATNSVVATVNTGTNPVALAVNPLSNTIYVANSGSNNITVINGAINTASTVTDPNAITPVAVALDPLTNMVYVANSGSNNVSVINGNGNTLVRTIGVGSNPTAIAINPATNMVYVANRGSGNVSVINGANNTLVATVPTGANPVSLSVNTPTNTIYVANNGSSTLTAISGSSNTVLATINTGSSPIAVAANPVTETVYVANNGSSNVTVVNAANNTVTATVSVGTNPSAVATDPTTNQIYVSNNVTNNVTVINGTTNATTTVADPNAVGPAAIAVDPVTDTVYVANNGSGNVTVIDADVNLVTTTLSTGSAPVAVVLNAQTNRVYVVNSAASSVTVIDGNTNSILTSVNTGTSPVAAAVNSATNRLYVANSGNNTLTVIDGSNNSVVTTVNTGSNPVAVTVNPVTNTIYVANNASGNVTVIDGANNQVMTTVAVGTAPIAIAANPATGLAYVANKGSDNVTAFDPVVSSNITITDPLASQPAALVIDAQTNKIFVANSDSDNVSIIDGASLSIAATVKVGDTPTALDLDPISNRVYVANHGSGNVSVIDGSALSLIATVPVGTAPSAVSVNPTLNRIYVANNGNNSTDLGSVTIIDGTSNTTVTVADSNANEPYALAANPVTGELYVANNLTSNASVITAEQLQTNPIVVAIGALPNNQTSNETPTFNFSASNGFGSWPLDELLFQTDTWQGPWTAATPIQSGQFSGTTATLVPGLHTIYAYATEGEEATSAITGPQSSPLIGTIASYGFLVATPLADVTPLSLSFGNQQVGTQSSSQTMTLGNAGSAPLTFSYMVSPSAFSEAPGDTCSSAGGQLAPNTSCTIFVVFDPSTAGANAGAVTITDNSNNISGSQQVVALSGNGTTPTFALNVAIDGTGAGMVTSNPAGISCPSTCVGNFAVGTQVTLTASPAAGSVFLGWSGACSGRGTCTVTMNSNQSLTATFRLTASTSCTGNTTNWIGGASGNWNNPSNWSTGMVPNSNTVNVCINDGASPPSAVTLDINATVANLYIDSGSSLTIPNNTILYAAGNVSNSGQITINAAANNSYLAISAGVSLTGGGTVILSNTGAGGVAVIEQNGGQTFTNVNNTIQGNGYIGWNGLTVVNQDGGIINANSTAGTLVLNPPNLTNQGLLEATVSGTLQLTNTYNNSGGRILASGSGSTINITGATIQGGTLTSSNGGVLGTLANTTATLDGSSQGPLTIAGTYVGANNTITYIAGTINNTGNIQINAAANNSYLAVYGATSLTGGGSVTLSTTGAGGVAVIDQSGAETLTNANNTLQGTGYIGWNGLTVVNQAAGLIDANSTTGPLILNPPNLTNQGLLEATSSATLQLTNTYNNAGGKILANGSGSTVNLNSATIQGGTLSGINGGTVNTPANANATLDGSSQGTLTIVGSYVAGNNTITYINGTINNTGNIQINAGVNNSSLAIAGPVNLTGAGSVSLTTTGGPGTGVAVIDQYGGETLTNVNNTLQGSGYIGWNGLTVVNQGTVNANLPLIGPMIVNPGGLTNEGVLEATAGATLQLNGNTFNNTGGTIAANGSGSIVQFANGVVIQSGTIATSGGGSLGVAINNNISLDGNTHGPLTIAGTYTGANNSITYITGTINNTGSIQINATVNNTSLAVYGPVSLVGNGSVVLSTTGSGLAVIDQSGGQTLTNVDNTLQGTGYIGWNGLHVINGTGGVINANVTTGPLVLNPSGLTNQGLLEASVGGNLTLSNSTINNQSGTIKVNGATSSVQFVNDVTIQGGTVTAVNNGILTTPSGSNIFFDGVTEGPLTIAGTYIGSNNTITYITGTITNTGTIQLNAGANNTSLAAYGTVTLNGGGTVTLSSTIGAGTAAIDQSGSQTLTNVNNTLQGTGIIGYNNLSLVNQGTIDANVPGAGNALTLNPNGFTNQGLLEATIGGTLSLSNSTINNSAGTIKVNGSTSTIQFVNGATIQGGTLATANNGILTIPSGNITLDGSSHGTLTIAGTYVGANNTITYITGTINNTGTIQLNAAANNTYLAIAGTVSLTGGGAVTLSTTGTGGLAVIDQSGAETLTNVNNVLQGTGYIGWNGLSIVNQGTINANASAALVLNPNGFTNQGLLEATIGGTLSLSNSTINNRAGTIQVSGASSTVQFVNGATIQGGTVGSANGGTLTIPSGNNITLDGNAQGALTLIGSYVGANNTITYLVGTINNTGNIQLNASSNNTYLAIAGSVSLTGAGTVTLNTSGGGLAIIDQSGGETLTNVSNTIQGTGYIGWNGLSVVNQGTINANVASPLILNPGALANQGMLEATGSSTLQVSTTVNSAGGSIVANGSAAAVQFANGLSIQGGTLNTLNGGFIGSTSGNALTLDGTANPVSIAAGAAYVVGNNSTTTVLGTINNNGTLLLNSTGNTTTLNSPSGAMLSGNGTVRMTNSANVITGASLINAGNAILNSAAFTVTSFTQSAGLLDVATTGTASTTNFNLSGGIAQVDGTLTISGTLSSSGTGTLSGIGSVIGNVSMSGITQAGDIPNPGILTIGINGVGNYTQGSAGSYDVVIGGLKSGAQYSQLNVPATASLNGTLNASLINNFVPVAGNSFTILTASVLSGQFVTTNLPSLPPNLTWMVNYNTNAVVLSVMQAANTYTLTVNTLGTGSGTVTDNFQQIDCTDTNGVQSGICQANYEAGTTVTLTETPVPPSVFGGWGGACSGTGGCSVLMNSNQTVDASFVPPPITMQVPFSCPNGMYPCFNVTGPPAVFNCPSGGNPCMDPNAHSLALTAAQVNTAFTMTVAANEVSTEQANGDCESGQSPSTDFDCRFTSFFAYETLQNGDIIVPACDAYSAGNCVFYSVYFGTRGMEPPTSDYAGPISWSIAWNNTSYGPPMGYPYQANNPRLYDDPDYEVSPSTPYGTNCNQPMLINGIPTNPPIYCQFVFDITTYYNPNQPPDAGIGGKTKQFNDVVVAFPLSVAAPNLSLSKTADQSLVQAGNPIGYTIAFSNSSAPGTGSATNVMLSDPLPAGANVNWAITPPYNGPGTCTITGQPPTQTLSCAIGSLSPAIGGSVHVASSDSSAGTYVNTVTLTAQSTLTSTAIIQVVNGSGPIAKITPSRVNFGDVYLRTPSVRYVTLTNTGGGALDITSIKISLPGNDLDDFGRRNYCPASLAAGKSCRIWLGFLADRDNYSPTATLVITDNASGSPQSVPLMATVINPIAELQPTKLNFGNQQIGTTSPPQTVTLTNIGTTNLLLTKVAINGSFAFAEGTTCGKGMTLPPRSDCVMNVTFTPTQQGPQTGVITIHDNALIRRKEVKLSGIGD